MITLDASGSTQNKLHNAISKEFSFMAFLYDEIINDTCKVDVVLPNGECYNLI